FLRERCLVLGWTRNAWGRRRGRARGAGLASTAMETRAEIMAWRLAQRVRLQEERRALTRDERAQKTARIAALLERHVPELAGASVGFCWPFKGELDLRDFAISLHAAGARLSLPVLVEKAAPLEFWHWAPGTRLARGDWGIPVPAERVFEHPTAL